MVGQNLVAVTFILDYFQLQFANGSRLNVTTQTSIQGAEGSHVFPEGLFCSGLVALINRVVTAVKGDDYSLQIIFGNFLVELSLRPEDFRVEAYYFQSAHGSFAVHN